MRNATLMRAFMLLASLGAALASADLVWPK
jgi:hypothetical protein